MANDAQKILNMIENVNPDDIEILNEIDARVWCYVFRGNDYKYEGRLKHMANTAHFPDRIIYYSDGKKHTQFQFFTRSRDALKAIRPEGWEFRFDSNCGSNICEMFKSPDGIQRWEVEAPILPTEELAELHAIIQAIQWERDNASNIDQ